MAMNDLNIREATYGDEQSIAEIQLWAWHMIYPDLMGKTPQEKHEFLEKEKAFARGRFSPEKSSDSATLVAELNGRIIGFCVLAKAIDRLPFNHVIGELNVLSNYQGYGVAKSLLSKTCDVAIEKGIKDIGGVVQSDNRRAKEWYLKLQPSSYSERVMSRDMDHQTDIYTIMRWDDVAMLKQALTTPALDHSPAPEW